MSLHSLKLQLDGRSGRELWPTYFSIDLLILSCRELAIHRAGHHSYDEFIFITAVLKNYFLRTTLMRGQVWHDLFRDNADNLLPLLSSELYDVICEEIVSKLIDVDIRTDSLQARLTSVIETEVEMTGVS